MIKKILLLLVLVIIINVGNVLAEAFDVDENSVTAQEYIYKNASEDAKKQIMDTFDLTQEEYDANLTDGKNGEITKALIEAQKAIAEAEPVAEPAAKEGGSEEVIGSGPCSYDGIGSVASALEKCVAGSDSKLVKNSGDLKVEDGFKKALMDWTTKIATFLAFGAIFSIAFGSLKMVLSLGEEEKIKKGKDVIKWGIIGFLGVVSAGFLISVVVKVVYTIGS